MPEKKISDELADLTEAVRELRDREVAAGIRELRTEIGKLRAEREHHHCGGCSCTHVHWYPNTWTYPGVVTYPNYVVTCGGDTNTMTTTTSNYNASAVNTFSITN